MSKHKHKIPYNEKYCNTCKNGNNPISNNIFGINPSQLLGMLGGNFNMNGLGSLLANMNKEGFNLNSMGANPNVVNKNGNKENINNKSKVDNNTKSESDDKIDKDKNIEMLIALKSIVDPDRIIFIDRLIELYESDVPEENLKEDE